MPANHAPAPSHSLAGDHQRQEGHRHHGELLEQHRRGQRGGRGAEVAAGHQREGQHHAEDAGRVVLAEPRRSDRDRVRHQQGADHDPPRQRRLDEHGRAEQPQRAEQHEHAGSRRTARAAPATPPPRSPRPGSRRSGRAPPPRGGCARRRCRRACRSGRGPRRGSRGRRGSPRRAPGRRRCRSGRSSRWCGTTARWTGAGRAGAAWRAASSISATAERQRDRRSRPGTTRLRRATTATAPTRSAARKAAARAMPTSHSSPAARTSGARIPCGSIDGRAEGPGVRAELGQRDRDQPQQHRAQREQPSRGALAHAAAAARRPPLRSAPPRGRRGWPGAGPRGRRPARAPAR